MTIINTWDSCDDLIRGTFGHVIQYSVPDLGSVQIGTRHESLCTYFQASVKLQAVWSRGKECRFQVWADLGRILAHLCINFYCGCNTSPQTEWLKQCQCILYLEVRVSRWVSRSSKVWAGLAPSGSFKGGFVSHFFYFWGLLASLSSCLHSTPVSVSVVSCITFLLVAKFPSYKDTCDCI